MDHFESEEKCYECGRLKAVPFECIVCHHYACGLHYMMREELCDDCFENKMKG